MTPFCKVNCFSRVLLLCWACKVSSHDRLVLLPIIEYFRVLCAIHVRIAFVTLTRNLTSRYWMISSYFLGTPFALMVIIVTSRNSSSSATSPTHSYGLAKPSILACRLLGQWTISKSNSSINNNHQANQPLDWTCWPSRLRPCDLSQFWPCTLTNNGETS